MSELFGRPFMPWQRQVADVALEILPDGRWAYTTVVVTVPRQAGKTAWLESLIVHRGQMLKLASMWLTAQTGKKARSRFLAMADRVNLWQAEQGLTGDARMFVSNIGVSHEMLRWTETGSKLFPFAPEGKTDKSEDMHGESPDLISADEIWVHSMETAKKLQQAYVPGMGTKNAQQLLTSTQGDAGSEWLNSLTESGRAAVEAGRNAGMAYFEWSIPEVSGGIRVQDLADEALLELVVAHHPAVGHTWTAETVAAHLDTFRQLNDREGFIRGYGNLRLAGGGSRALPEATWDGASTTLELPEPYALGLAYEEEDPGTLALGAAGRHESGQAVLELAAPGSGGWLTPEGGERQDPVEYVAEHYAANDACSSVAVLNSGPGRLAADRLEELGVPVHRIPVADYRAACPTVLSDLGRRVTLHRSQPTLNAAAANVTFNRSTSGFAWTSPGPGSPVCALSSVTLALLAADRPVEEVPDSVFRVF